MEPHPVDLKGWYLAVVSPAVHVSTKDAYASIEPQEVHFDWDEIRGENASRWSALGLINHFEIGVSKMHPEIGRAKSKLLEMGASYASMTGSGSSVYALFTNKPNWSESDGWLIEL